MFGLVRKALLVKAEEKNSSLEEELIAARWELSAIKDVVESPKYKKIVDLAELESELESLQASYSDIQFHCKAEKENADQYLSDIKVQCENELDAHRKNIELDLSELASQVEEANQKKELMLSQAEASRDKIIKNAHLEADSISEEKLAKLNSDLEFLKIKKQALDQTISKLEEDILDLEMTKENHDVISTVSTFDQLIDGSPSEDIKEKLELVKEKKKTLIKNGKAFIIKSDILWNNNLSKGRARQKRQAKFLLTAFNAEVDNIIAKTSYRNFSASTKKIEKWFHKVNKSGSDSFLEITRELLFLRLEEQRHVFEYNYRKQAEIEEQRFMRESIREEEKVKREIESFITAREKEEKAYQSDLDKAISEANSANDEEVKKLNAHIAELRLKLERATSEKERALSMAQLTRSGYVYIISNKGSFGEDVYKIGMTRRLEPMDRVKELGGASVPYYFDVHALIPSDDAPALENKLHSRFSQQRVNKINHRREFFKLTFKEIQDALDDYVDEDFNLVKDVLSEQYEESIILEGMEEANG
ncbi:DUF4041 domain-containing protein [Oceanospirillum maris]|uniref:DUF4041 domain-containing protein n=1 Tax=Oceanospirillum maris TaxID=64977 RepID=UPI000410DA59|nr:DUF4041 domain-containing protein [Oceanospirillum maris]